MPSVDLWGEEHPDRAAIGSHQTNGGGGSDEWLTPPALLQALGPFDLDPCAPRAWPHPEWPRAATCYTIEDGGLREELPWDGRVWLRRTNEREERCECLCHTGRAVHATSPSQRRNTSAGQITCISADGSAGPVAERRSAPATSPPPSGQPRSDTHAAAAGLSSPRPSSGESVIRTGSRATSVGGARPAPESMPGNDRQRAAPILQSGNASWARSGDIASPSEDASRAGLLQPDGITGVSPARPEGPTIGRTATGAPPSPHSGTGVRIAGMLTDLSPSSTSSPSQTPTVQGPSPATSRPPALDVTAQSGTGHWSSSDPTVSSACPACSQCFLSVDKWRVWLNPPYSTASRWLARLAKHGRGTALLFARTETQMWFQHVWPHTTGILFLEGRLTFCYTDGRAASANSGAPSALIAYGDRDAEILAGCPLPGVFVTTGRQV